MWTGFQVIHVAVRGSTERRLPRELVYRLKPMAVSTALRSPDGIDAVVLVVEREEIPVTLDALPPILEDGTVGEFEVPVARSR
jgi:hypothetical protein